ncbi:MAG: two-component regulator propeller domain-containing protein [Bacteroidota bacterium]
MKSNIAGLIAALHIVLVLGLLTSPAKGQTIFLNHYTTKEGLPSNNCYFTLQDSKGYIWISTDAGVSRFDGKVFENFSIDDGLPDNQILQVKEDQSGKIWFLSLNGQLSYFFNGKIFNETNDSLLKLLKFNAIIVSFFQDSKGRIWFGTNRNLLVMLSGRSITKFISGNNDRQFINTFMHEDKQGRIWAYSNRSVRVMVKNTFEVVKHRSLPISYKTTQNLPNKTLAFVNKNGLNIREGYQESFVKPINPDLLNNGPGYFFADDVGSIWLSNNSGIHYIDKDGASKNYISNISASQIIKDDKNNMWFTTTNGIYMLPRKDERLYIIDESHGLSNGGVKSITRDKKNRLWLGMDEATINIVNLQDNKITKLFLPNTEKYSIIKQLSYDSIKNAIYFASEYGLGRITNANDINSRIDYLKESNNSMFVIKSFSISNRDSLSLALSSGVVILPNRYKKFAFNSFKFKINSDFFPGRAYCVFFDQKQKLWFSSINGLSELADDKTYNYYDKNSLLTKRINDIQQLPDGTIVLATDGYGIILIRDKKIVRLISQRDGLSDNICKKLFIKGGKIWVITNRGINRISLEHNKTAIETYEYTNPLLKDDVSGLYVDDSFAFFGTNQGLVYFPINLVKPFNESPKIFISSIVNNDTKLNLSRPDYILDPSDNNITFYYSAIEFQNKDITYRYRLKTDANWTETKTRRLEFSSLEPGKYTFQLSAKSNDGNWSRPAIVNFELEKHFWQSIWFIVSLFIIGLLLFYKIAIGVTRRQKNKEKEQLLLKNKILMLEQRALQAMMNPHFVFNVMNSIQHYINTKDTGSANKILTGFARLIRKNLEICTKSYISVDEEIEYLELYLSLEKKRFGGKLNYNIRISSNIDREETLLPSMILQPYIENAIWHGIMPKDDGGNIEISLDLLEGNKLLIQIKDDGIGIENSLKEKKGQHISKGMSLTNERINLLNQVEANPIQINVKQGGNSGTYVSITIPLQ